MWKYDHTTYFSGEKNPPYYRKTTQNGHRILPSHDPLVNQVDRASRGTKAWKTQRDIVANYTPHKAVGDGAMSRFEEKIEDDANGRGITKAKRWFTGKIFKDFCNETSIHGFNHIVAPNRSILERIGWAIATLLAALGAVQLCLEQWQRYVASPTVMSLEKDYRTWNNTFLALTACLVGRCDPDQAVKLINRLWDVKPTDDKFAYYLQFVETVANASLNDLSTFEPFVGDTTLKDVDLFEIATEVALPFKGLVAWFDRSINTSFVNVMTEHGICHTINSIVSRSQRVHLASSRSAENPTHPISCNYITKPCYLRVELYKSCVSYYVHSSFDVFDISTEATVAICMGRDFNTDWNVLETRASLDVHALSVDQRKCRFHSEHTGGDKQEYSNSICRQECRQRMALKLCGCRPFFYFLTVEPTKPCGPEGMVCLSKHRESLIRLSGCTCLPQCVDSTYELSYIKESVWSGPFAERSSIKIGILPPRSRYRRQILFCFEDLVVSFGGAAGLFLGCSFLSGIEIVYFLLARFLSTIYRYFGGKRIPQNRVIEPDDKLATAKESRKRREIDTTKHGMNDLIQRIAEFE